MFGDFFLDQCLTACCSLEDNCTYSNEMLRSIYFIMKWYKTEKWEEKNPSPVNDFQEKLDIVYFISQFRCVNKEKFIFQEFLDKMLNGKFRHLIPKLQERKIQLEEDDIKDLKNKILIKKKLCELLKGKKQVQSLINDIESGNYIDESEVMSRWESELSHLYQNLMDINAQKSIEDACKLNLVEDDYTPVLLKLRESLNSKDTLKTGYKSIDERLPAKGFESRRLYLIGGSSGVGKSAFLLNLLRNSINIDRDTEKPNYYIYITAENLIDESLLRFYCCSTGDPIDIVVDRLREDPSFNLKTELKNLQSKSNSVVLFYYVEARRTKIQEVEGIINLAQEQTECKVRALFLDYLDLINPNDLVTTSENIRIAQGMVSQELKNIAVRYSIPVITATQLNRSGYDAKAEPSLTQMGESMLKIDNSDFVLFIQPASDSVRNVPSPHGNKQYAQVRMTILKNRNGSIGQSVQLVMPSKLNNESIFNFRFEESPSITKDFEGDGILDLDGD